MDDLEQILETASGPGFHVSEELLPLVYDELRNIASKQMAGQGPGQTLQATALVHEAWIRLSASRKQNWNDRVHFFRTASLAMRQILVKRAQAKATLKRRMNRHTVELDFDEVEDPSPDERILEVDAALTELEVEDSDSARIVTLKFFGGLTNREIAAMDQVAERSIERRWAYARGRLYQLIREQVS